MVSKRIAVFCLFSQFICSCLGEPTIPPDPQIDTGPPRIAESHHQGPHHQELPPDPITQGVTFLKRFGYLKEGNEHNAENLEDAIRAMQSFNGLEVTGKLDDMTMAKMQAPRCGMADLDASQGRAKRWLKKTAPFPFPTFNYVVENTPTLGGLSMAAVESAVEQAMAVWTAVCSRLVFNRVAPTAPRNMTIKFALGNHSDGYPFDSVGGVLGHGFYPQSGVLHFDNAETWLGYPPSGTGKSVVIVAVHEVGHVLGLGHSNVTGATMGPYYNSGWTALGQDDIDGIRAMYGC